jgi:cobalt-zinc-cadmium efflux system membrane fusion protein
LPIVLAAVWWSGGVLLGHENHAPLPTKGVKIAGDQILVSAKGREAIGMTLAKVTLGDLRRVLQINARVELPWRQQAMIASLVPGKIEQVLVRPGDSVRAGQELARVASVELESLQSAFLQATAERAIAERVATQRTALAEQGTIAAKNLLEARATLAEKLAAQEIARQRLVALGFDAERLREIVSANRGVPWISIVSPIEGMVTHADVRVGQAVEPTDHLYHVVDLSTLWIVGEVLEADVAHLAAGQEVEATLSALPGQPLQGRIDHLRLKMDPHTRTEAVVVAVDNRDRRLRPGMFGRLDVEVQVAREAVFCPADALVETRHGAYVLVERGEGKYVNQAVKLGLKVDQRVEVLDGLFPGDRVVVVGNYLLASLLGNEHKARVKTATATKSDPRKTEESGLVLQASVELPTNRQAYATARVEGRVVQIEAHPSQAVRAGQVLVQLESLPLRNLQLGLLQTVTRERWTAQSLARLEVAGADVPKRQLWQLQNELAILRQTMSGMGRRLSLLGLTDADLDRLQQAEVTPAGVAQAVTGRVSIRAPIDGWIVGLSVVPGQVVRPEDRVLEIHDLSKVWAKGYVFERDATRVRIGQPARLGFAAYPDWEVSGVVVRMGAELDASERVLPVWIEVDNPQLRLKQGMLARVVLDLQPAAH